MGYLLRNSSGILIILVDLGDLCHTDHMHKRVSDEELIRRVEAARDQLDLTGIYTHYRHIDSRYRIVMVALSELNERPCVIYQNLGHPDLVWVRDLEDWLVQVPTETGELVPRFTKLAHD